MRGWAPEVKAVLEAVLVGPPARSGRASLEEPWCWLRCPAEWGWVEVALEGLAQVDGLNLG